MCSCWERAHCVKVVRALNGCCQFSMVLVPEAQRRGKELNRGRVRPGSLTTLQIANCPAAQSSPLRQLLLGQPGGPAIATQ
ncbi:MAG TPA: hypothetical protein VKX16_05780 [Chloroflexota bacterium]|nr:hypothetical protein [Chloroflexota bacterium]